MSAAMCREKGKAPKFGFWGLIPSRLLPKNPKTSRDKPEFPNLLELEKRGGWKINVYPGREEAAFPNPASSTGSSLSQPWPLAKFLNFFLRESRRKRARLPPALTFLPPARNPGDFGAGNCWVAEGDGPNPLPSVPSLGVTFRPGL